eukprot:COSAG05_NODE_195_length_14550_cov_203.233686_7_plen_87_part_00
MSVGLVNVYGSARSLVTVCAIGRLQVIIGLIDADGGSWKDQASARPLPPTRREYEKPPVRHCAPVPGIHTLFYTHAWVHPCTGDLN